MRALIAVALLALTAVAVPAAAEPVGHCLAQDACTSVYGSGDAVCLYHGQGRGSALVACSDGRDTSVTRCEAGSGCKQLV